MGTKKEPTEKPSRPKGKRATAAAVSRRQQQKLVKSMLAKLAADLDEGKGKATLADYIRLVQLQKEIEKDDPRDLKVGWVDHLENGDEPSSS